MDHSQPIPSSNAADRDLFLTTRWSVVQAAGDSGTEQRQQALVSLCEAYWVPLYAYARRRTGSVDEAQDLTQAFFAEFLEKEFVCDADPQRGRFRAFLLAVFKHFMAKQWRAARAAKRGGGKHRHAMDFAGAEGKLHLEPLVTLTAEQLYDRHWALSLLDQILGRLHSEWEQDGRADLFASLKPFLVGDRSQETYAEIATRHGLSQGGVKMMVHRLRGRYRDLLRNEIAGTVSGPEEVEDEIRWLFTVLQR